MTPSAPNVASPSGLFHTALCVRPIPFDEVIYIKCEIKTRQIAMMLNLPVGSDLENRYCFSKNFSDINVYLSHVYSFIRQFRENAPNAPIIDFEGILFVTRSAHLVSAWKNSYATRAIFATGQGDGAGGVDIAAGDPNTWYQFLLKIISTKSEIFFDSAQITSGFDGVLGLKLTECLLITPKLQRISLRSPLVPDINFSFFNNNELFEEKAAYLKALVKDRFFVLSNPRDPYISLNLDRIQKCEIGSHSSLIIHFIGQNRSIQFDLGSQGVQTAQAKLALALERHRMPNAIPSECEPVTTASFSQSVDCGSNVIPVKTLQETSGEIILTTAPKRFLSENIVYTIIDNAQRSIRICIPRSGLDGGNRFTLFFPTQEKFENEADTLNQQIDQLRTKLARFPFVGGVLKVNSFFVSSLWCTAQIAKFYFVCKDQGNLFKTELQFPIQQPDSKPFDALASMMEANNQTPSLFFQDNNSRCQLSLESIDLLITLKQKHTWMIISAHAPSVPYEPHAARDTFKKKTQKLMELLKEKLYLLTDNASTSVSIKLGSVKSVRFVPLEQKVTVEFLNRGVYDLTQDMFGTQPIVDTYLKLNKQLVQYSK